MTDEYEFFRDKHPDDRALTRAETYLQRGGCLPTEEPYSGTSASLLVRFLRDQPEPDLGALIAAAEKLTDRGEPAFPEAARLWDDPSRTVVHQPVPQLIWVNPQRIFPNRDYEDKGDWTRSQDKPLEARNHVLGLAEFARRIAQERGDVRGLVELLGPDGEAAHVDLDGWETPLGAFFRVNANGNHRAAAFAILGAPCIPATVHWNPGPYSASTSTNSAADEVLCAYRVLLHCYGVASYPDPDSALLNSDQIVSEWPFLIDSADSAACSLTVLEQIAGRRHDEPIGRLPRELFDDAQALLSAGRRTRRALEQNRRTIEARGSRSLLQIGGLARLRAVLRS